MKTTNIFIAIVSFLAATLTLVSCKKDTEPDPIPQKDIVRTITTDSYTAEFIYNAWENGNMTAVSGTLNAEIGYGDIVNNTNLDFIYLISPGYLSQIAYPYGSLIGLLGTSPANMPESETCYIEGYDAQNISYSYTLDDEGRITSININNNGAESTVSIEY